MARFYNEALVSENTGILGDREGGLLECSPLPLLSSEYPTDSG